MQQRDLAVERLVNEAIEQGHGQRVADSNVLSTVATIVARAERRKAVVIHAPADRLTTDPAGDIISPRIQYLEQWIRDCQHYNRRVAAKLIAAEDRIRDLESLLETKNAKLREGSTATEITP
jgi:hypothetical protein